jgi:fibronectin type 3 domain-containing protein
MHKKVKITIILALLICINLLGCSRKIKNPVSDYREIEVPPTPQNIIVLVGDGKVELNWEVSDSSKVESFKIYRSDTSSITPFLIDSCFGFSYVSRGLKNGKEYFYQVSAVDLNGFEGYKSEIVRATPNLFSVVINSGQKVTSSRDVTLSLAAPSGTSYTMFGNDSLFSGAYWERYNLSKNWRLESGDGEKWVYVKFKDRDGNVCIDFYQSSIILDTQAHIVSVSENTGGLVKTTGQTIHFRLNSGEANGQARVDLGSISNIILYNNGQFGDTVANDSIYELDYVIPPGVEMENATVTGHFTDEAGNIAPTATAPGKVTIRIPPDPVVLLKPSGQTQSSLTLYWSQSASNDFRYYQLYRAKTSSVDTNSTSVTIISSRTTTTYADTNLQDTTTYYYRIYVYDNTGLSTPSNIESATTLKNQPPQAVVLSITSVNSDSAVVLSWTENEDEDFESYRIYKSQAPDTVTINSNVIKIINQASTTSFTNEDVLPSLHYYYKVFVFDKGGLYTPSRQVYGP